MKKSRMMTIPSQVNLPVDGYTTYKINDTVPHQSSTEDDETSSGNSVFMDSDNVAI